MSRLTDGWGLRKYKIVLIFAVADRIAEARSGQRGWDWRHNRKRLLDALS